MNDDVFEIMGKGHPRERYEQLVKLLEIITRELSNLKYDVKEELKA